MTDQQTETDHSTGALTRYRVMATVVGVLLVVLVLIGVPLHYGYLLSDAAFLAAPAMEADRSTAGAGWRLGAAISGYLGVAHGWLYMIFLVMGLLLARRERWSPTFTIITMACGTVPLLSFWAERRATRLVRAGADV